VLFTSSRLSETDRKIRSLRAALVREVLRKRGVNVTFRDATIAVSKQDMVSAVEALAAKSRAVPLFDQIMRIVSPFLERRKRR